MVFDEELQSLIFYEFGAREGCEFELVRDFAYLGEEGVGGECESYAEGEEDVFEWECLLVGEVDGD